MTTKQQIDQFIESHKQELVGMVDHCYAIGPMAEVGRGIDQELNLHPAEWAEVMTNWNPVAGRWDVQPFGTLFDAYWRLYRTQFRDYAHVHPAHLPGPSPRDKQFSQELGGDYFLTLWGTGIGRYVCISIVDKETGTWTDETRVLE